MSTLSTDVLRNVILVSSFRGDDLHRAQAALLLIGLTGIDFDAGMLPGEICGDDVHLAGMACASLCAQKLIVGVGRVKSSSPLANGRKVTLWRITNAALARTALARWGYLDTPSQQEMQLA